MTLAAVLGFYLLTLGWPPSLIQNSAPASQAQHSQSQNTEPAQASTPSTSQTPSSTSQAKPAPAKPRHHKKPLPPNCSNAPTPLNPAPGASADATKAAGSQNASSAASPALPPCPPPKKVVRNGGSDEPAIQLTGGTSAEQAAHQNSTNELTAATEENLKKIAGSQLSPSQQDTVTQIKEFLNQSKSAVAEGDLERGQNLAQKAHLLSEELVKP
jgi:hypothetical protein